MVSPSTSTPSPQLLAFLNAYQTMSEGNQIAILGMHSASWCVLICVHFTAYHHTPYSPPPHTVHCFMHPLPWYLSLVCSLYTLLQTVWWGVSSYLLPNNITMVCSSVDWCWSTHHHMHSPHHVNPPHHIHSPHHINPPHHITSPHHVNPPHHLEMHSHTHPASSLPPPPPPLFSPRHNTSTFCGTFRISSTHTCTVLHTTSTAHNTRGRGVPRNKGRRGGGGISVISNDKGASCWPTTTNTQCAGMCCIEVYFCCVCVKNV